jgi:hypothetical protein
MWDRSTAVHPPDFGILLIYMIILMTDYIIILLYIFLCKSLRDILKVASRYHREFLTYYQLFLLTQNVNSLFGLYTSVSPFPAELEGAGEWNL